MAGDTWQNVSMAGDVSILQTGTTSIGLDKVDNTNIDWGTGEKQVSADDIPDGSTYIIPTSTQEQIGTQHTVGEIGPERDL